MRLVGVRVLHGTAPCRRGIVEALYTDPLPWKVVPLRLVAVRQGSKFQPSDLLLDGAADRALQSWLMNAPPLLSWCEHVVYFNVAGDWDPGSGELARSVFAEVHDICLDILEE